MAYVLHIDTASDKGLVAIAKDGKLISQQVTATARDHASSINLMIDQVVRTAAISLKDVDAIAVIGGPGSYTGLRIGLATAKALCYVLEKPLIMNNKLAILALQHNREGQTNYGFLASVLPARQKEYFFALYNRAGDALFEPTHILEDDLVNQLRAVGGKMLLIGPAGAEISTLTDMNQVDYLADDEIDLDYWCLKAQADFDCHRFVNLANAEPFYLKQVYTHKP